MCTRNRFIKKQSVVFRIYGREDNYSSIRTNFMNNPCVSIIVFPGNSSSLSTALIKRNQKLPPSRVSDLSEDASLCLYLHILLCLGRGTPLIGCLLICVLCFSFLYWLDLPGMLNFPILFAWGQEGFISLMSRVFLIRFNQEGRPLKSSASGLSQIDLEVSKWGSFRCL